MRFRRLVTDPVRPEQHLAAVFERKNADLTRTLDDPDRPVPGHRRVLLNQSLNDAGCEQHGVDIVRQCRAVVAMTVDTLDRVAHVKSIKRHEILMPRLTTSALTSIKSADFCALVPGPEQVVE